MPVYCSTLLTNERFGLPERNLYDMREGKLAVPGLTRLRRRNMQVYIHVI